MGIDEPVMDESEGRFLAYIACRINHEVGRFQREEQCATRTRAHIRLLAHRALEILGGRDELDAWLNAGTQVTELLWAPGVKVRPSPHTHG
jgi:hypothetical protein